MTQTADEYTSELETKLAELCGLIRGAGYRVDKLDKPGLGFGIKWRFELVPIETAPILDALVAAFEHEREARS